MSGRLTSSYNYNAKTFNNRFSRIIMDHPKKRNMVETVIPPTNPPNLSPAPPQNIIQSQNVYSNEKKI
ncbi:MAG: hypothetical protein LBR40_00170 [Bacilli bacterium]|jgi:hypothetical protein|nr:hypothetical protein [Bacilli bacterium]